MTTLPCNYDEFKQQGKVFFDLVKTANRDELEAGLKCINLMYLGLKASELDMYQASLILNMAAGKYLDRLILLEVQP